MATEQIPQPKKKFNPDPTLSTATLASSFFRQKWFVLVISAIVIAVILMFLIPELSRNIFLSVASVTIVLALCWTALPLAELLFDEIAAQRIFVFPIGFISHAVLLSFAGYVFGINGVTFTVYFIIMTFVFFLTRRFKRSVDKAETKLWTLQDSVWLLIWLVIVAAAVLLPFAGVGR